MNGAHKRQDTPIPWNKGKLVGQERPPKLQEVWPIRIRLQLANRARDLAIDSKLRSCYLVKLKVYNVYQGSSVVKRAMVLQQKTQRPVRFEITEKTRDSVESWLRLGQHRLGDYLFWSREDHDKHMTSLQYAHIVKGWVSEIGLNPVAYGTHSMRRTKPTLIYKRTKNLRVVQLLLGHTKLESTVRYLGIEVDDALEIAKQMDV